MINLTMYGKPSSAYEYAKYSILNNAKQAEVEITVSEISDTKRFMTDLIDSIPAFRIENETKSLGKKNINDFIEEVNQWILKKENFGTMKKIIVPTDFSESAYNALEYAYQLAQQIDAVIQLIHIYYPSPSNVNEYVHGSPEIEKIMRNKFQEYALKSKTKLKEKYNASVFFDTSFELGFPADKLIELSKTVQNSLIVMGSNGETGALKRIWGSVSTKVAKKSKCPVLVVPPEAAYRRFEQVVCCSDSIALDAVSAHKVIDFIKPFEADVHLIHVGEEEPFEAKALLELWKNYYPKAKVYYDQVWGSNAVESINQFSAKNNADLVVVSTEKRSFLEDLFHRSFTKEMLITTQLPVLITHTNMVVFSV